MTDAGRAAASPRSPSPHLRRQLVAIGLAAVLVHVTIVVTALSGLRRINEAHAAVGRITQAQQHFQDADMAHDSMQAAALASLVQVGPDGAWAATPRDSADALRQATADFRADLRRVEASGLPERLQRSLREVQPLQERYAGTADQLLAQVAVDPPGARRLYLRFAQQHGELVDRQQVVTSGMAREARRLTERADDGEQSVRSRLAASAVVTLLVLLGLTAVLHRLGRTVTALLARQRGAAETLQHSLLPARLPDLPGLRLAARYVPSGIGTDVGGDWYDVLALPGGKVGLVMGDVVGHDLHAASSMGQLRNALRACAADGEDPAEVLQQLNRLCLSQDLGEMATVLYAVLDPVAGTVSIANAGHYPPLLVEGDGCRFLENLAFPPIKAVREVRYQSSVHPLPAQSRLLLYTDGLVERRGWPVDAGLDRLLALCGTGDGVDLEALCDQVLAGMLGDQPTDDDVALLIIAPQTVLGDSVEVLWPARAERLTMLRDLLHRWLSEVGAEEDETYDILVACSEAATNAIEHAYGPGRAEFRVACSLDSDVVTVVVRDWGQWREPRGQDRGRGTGLMQSLMDDVRVRHGEQGTEVSLRRRLRSVRAAPSRPSLARSS